MDVNGATLLFCAVLVLFVACCCCLCVERPDQPAESPEQRVARALAARAEATLATQAAAAAAPPVLMPLPYFPYAARSGVAAECSICLEPLRQWQLCSEVPACRHVFHRECLGAWARSNGSCPMCRAKIVPGSSDGVAVAVADDRV
ncbi:RING-H2 finger protein ATL39-like [Panicum miliaceum]|uniref:RING-type E3 ubiquitin transferase n=1 Tax=Panicum miliaceum TaxID=4540 RepID=A0A3L6S296_PANMI|nr:RING-H2 finger protein ATL39-like [Panicum miliaceum]